jgi:hypothetical protein
MERSGDGDYNQRWEARERARLPADVRARWDEALARKVLRPLPFKKAGVVNTAKALSREEPATRATLLNRTNRLLRLASSAGLPADLDGLLDPIRLYTVFETTGAPLRGQTKWGLCAALWRMAWELQHMSAGWILVGGRFYRMKDDGKIRPVDAGLPARVQARALEVQAGLLLLGELTMPQAIKLRTAAHAMLEAELGARLSETALPLLGQLSDGTAGMVLKLDRAHSKMGVAGRESISEQTAALIRDYLARGRPVLLRSDVLELSRGLWITEDALDAEGPTMAAAFGRMMKDLRPEGVCCTDIRRSLQSVEGQTFADMARRARHVPGSRTGPMVYTGRDRASAVASGIALSHLQEDDVPSFALPAPGKRRHPKAEPARYHYLPEWQDLSPQ